MDEERFDGARTVPSTASNGLTTPAQVVVHQFEATPPPPEAPDSKAYLTDEQRKAIADAFYDELQPRLGKVLRVAIKRVENGKITDLRLLELLIRIGWDMTKRGLVPQRSGGNGTKSDLAWLQELATLGVPKPEETDDPSD